MSGSFDLLILRSSNMAKTIEATRIEDLIGTGIVVGINEQMERTARTIATNSRPKLKNELKLNISPFCMMPQIRVRAIPARKNKSKHARKRRCVP